MRPIDGDRLEQAIQDRMGDFGSWELDWMNIKDVIRSQHQLDYADCDELGIEDGWKRIHGMKTMIEKQVAIPPNVITAVKYGQDRFSCRRCGYGLPDSDHKRRYLYVNGNKDLEPHWNYCPNCGQRILHASEAGCCGWSRERADRKYEEIVMDKIDETDKGRKESLSKIWSKES